MKKYNNTSARVLKSAPFLDTFDTMIPPQHVELDTPLSSASLDDGADILDSDILFEADGGATCVADDVADKIGQVVRGKDEVYVLKDLVGMGTFAAVYVASGFRGKLYAVKTLFKTGLSEEQVRLQRLEADIHDEVRDVPNVVGLVETIEDEACLYLVLEYCDDDLYNVIQAPGTSMSDSEVKALFDQVADAVQGMHANGVYHRDIKPENVLLSPEGHARVADFGLATRETWCEELACGTKGYLAPEALNEELEGYHPGPADVWALGILLVNMRFKCKLWDAADPDLDASYREFLHMGPYLYFTIHFPTFSKPLVKLLARVFAEQPERRPSVREFKQLITREEMSLYVVQSRAVAGVSKEDVLKALLKDDVEAAPIATANDEDDEDVLGEMTQGVNMMMYGNHHQRYPLRRRREVSCDSAVGRSLLQDKDEHATTVLSPVNKFMLPLTESPEQHQHPPPHNNPDALAEARSKPVTIKPASVTSSKPGPYRPPAYYQQQHKKPLSTAKSATPPHRQARHIVTPVVAKSFGMMPHAPSSTWRHTKTLTAKAYVPPHMRGDAFTTTTTATTTATQPIRIQRGGF